ncbi:MAG TPA: iron ABC transporter permease [Methanospirillum sp.]|uniref:FecCD family ABC transporter permease n=1 Tax=Methanospirillum sp. TaxID=45200 RepID=UPI002C59D4D5|nr:iron ABC transporter permease [Methanospirillum sp.]HWQ64856.1 iron ABC transporter permease [Methanospirillum sp.]
MSQLENQLPHKEKEKIGIKTAYGQYHSRKVLFLISIIAGIIILVGIAASFGSYDLSLTEVYTTILAGIFPSLGLPESVASTIIWEIRLPRIAMAIVSGASLGVAGAIMQGVLRNPLAEPFTLGISSAAAMGASLAIIGGLKFFGSYSVVINAFISAFCATMIIYTIAKSKGMTPEAIILAGIAIMFLLDAVTSFTQYLGTAEQVQAVVFWMMGSVSVASWDTVGIVFVIAAVSIPYLVLKASDITIIGAGDETAHSLGVNVEHVRMRTLVFGALLTASVTAFCGIIGFVGLVSPHITRMIIGGDNRYVIPGSALVGGILLLGADTVARTILAPMILPVGIMTAFVGVPFFMYLFMRKRKELW